MTVNYPAQGQVDGYGESMKWFQNKRQQIAKALPKNSVLILGSLPVYFRQADVSYPYRQDSDLYYLTGFTQESSLFILFSSGLSILFISDKDPVRETWEGPLYSPIEVKNKFLIDEVYPHSELDKKLSILLKRPSKVFYDKINPFFDKNLKPWTKNCNSSKEFLKNFRRIKDKTEIASIQSAIAISIQAHKQIAKALKPGINERALHGLFIKSIMEKGSSRESYGSIIACGKNATILHYTQNNSVCKKGELLLVDAGAEKNYYSSDITRVYPVSGKFTPNQKMLYEKLLKLQKKLIKKVCPGISLNEVNQEMFRGITKILMDMKLLEGSSLNTNVHKKAYQKYCPHGVGHLLGLDVHDVSFKKTEKAILEPGMVLTIEPGIYISPQEKKAAKDLRGLGLRIEDNILVTQTGQKNLTKNLTKEVKEIEKLCSSKSTYADPV